MHRMKSSRSQKERTLNWVNFQRYSLHISCMPQSLVSNKYIYQSKAINTYFAATLNIGIFFSMHKFIFWHASRHVSPMCWTCFMFPSGKKPTENVSKREFLSIETFESDKTALLIHHIHRGRANITWLPIGARDDTWRMSPLYVKPWWITMFN